MGLPRDEGALQRGLAFINDGFAKGQFKVRIDKTFSLDAVVEAHRYLEKSGHVGKVVLTV
jgi:NADPH:quinone reductase-like Zn-dependent oxidoreductase